MWVRGVLVIFTALAAAFSGCLSDGGEPKGADGPTAMYGSVRGQVLDDEEFPVQDAVVAVHDPSFDQIRISVNSNADGRFEIAQVPPGHLLLTVTKAGYMGSDRVILVRPGAVVEEALTVRALPDAAPRILEQSPFTGRFDCVASWGVGRGSCDALVPVEEPRVLNATPEFNFTVPAGWGGVLLELEWQSAGPASAVEGMRLEVWSGNGTGRLAEAQGPADVLRVQLDRGVRHSGAAVNWTLAASGGPILLRALPVGLGEGATCAAACLEGVGVAVEIDFKVWPTLFFGSGVDSTYSALDAPEN